MRQSSTFADRYRGSLRFKLLYFFTGVGCFETLTEAKARASELLTKGFSMEAIGFDIQDKETGKMHWGVLNESGDKVRLFPLLLARYRATNASKQQQ